MSIARLVTARTASALVVLALLSIVVFIGVDLLPGDPVLARLGGTADLAVIAEARARLGLDRPVLHRYLDWVAGLLRGDLGVSVTGRPVEAMLSERLGNSALLAGLTALLLVPLSAAIGVWAGLRSGSSGDRAVSTAALVCVAVPEFVVAGALVAVVAVGLGWAPAVSLVPAGASPLTVPEVLVLPLLSLLALGTAASVRVIRATTAAALRAPHVEFARLNGLSTTTVLRTAVLPAVLTVALPTWLVSAASLIGGAVLVEAVFAYPGVGTVLVDAVVTGDLPVVQSLAMLLGAAVLAALLAADLGLLALNPASRGSR